MATTLFHWTLHPWAIYAVVGLAIAYGVFRKGRSQLISSAFAPLLGERARTARSASVIDILAIFATLFGSAASLGLGALQIGSGLKIVAGIGKVGNAGARRHHRVLTVGLHRSRPCPASPRASSGCPTSTWCWRSRWRCSSSSSARRSSSSTWSRPRSAPTSRTSPRCRRAPTPRAATPWRSGSPAGRSSTGPGGSRWTPFVGMFIARISAAARSASSSPACCWCRAWSR